MKRTVKGDGARRSSARRSLAQSKQAKVAKLTGVLWHEGNLIVSKCPELGVASCGETVEEALENLREAVTLYLENARELGLLTHIPALIESERFTTQFEVTLR